MEHLIGFYYKDEVYNFWHLKWWVVAWKVW